jgi:hypothetical protein
MEKKINVWLDGYWQLALNKPKTKYTSISLDAILCEAIEQLEKRKISKIVKEIMEQKPYAHILAPSRGLSRYIQAVLIERLAAAAGINISLLAVSEKFQKQLKLKKAKMETK